MNVNDKVRMKESFTGVLQVLCFITSIICGLITVTAAFLGFEKVLEIPFLISFLIILLCFLFIIPLIPLSFFGASSMVEIFNWSWPIAIFVSFPFLFIIFFLFIGKIFKTLINYMNEKPI